MVQQPDSPDIADRVVERLTRELIIRESTVTKMDVAGLDTKIQALNQRLGHAIWMIGAVIALLIATYGGLTWFTWRLTDTLLKSQ